ncbi:MAG TPA: hypothetical protein PKO06_16750, partial [Candidatus Ozemobacteraceae bacterium]|nr:hypothetical protein [Candidatus Ozemobacteraceae bacterium]
MVSATGQAADRGGGIIRHATVVAWLSIPFLLVAMAYAWYWDFRARECRGQDEKQLQGMLTAWGSEAVPEYRVRRILEAVDQRIFGPGMTRQRQKRLLQGLHRRFPGWFRFTVLDADGVPSSELCDLPQPKAAWQRVNAAYRQFLAGDPEPLKNIKTTVRSLLGSFVTTGRRMSGTMLRADADRRRRWLYAGLPQADGWFIAHVAAQKDWFSLPLQDRIDRWNERQSPVRLYLLQGVPPRPETPDLASAPIAQLYDRLDPLVWDGDSLWGLQRVGPRLSLVAVRHNTWPRGQRREAATIAWLILAFWLSTIVVGTRPRVTAAALAISIKWRLAASVGFATALPFAIIACTTLAYVREHGHKLEGDLYFRMEGALRDLDDLAPFLIERQNALLLKQATELSWPVKRPDIWDAHLKKLERIAPWDLAKIYGPGGKTLLTNASHSSLIWSPEDLGIFGQAAKHCLRRMQVQDPDASAEEKTQGLSFLENTMANIAGQTGKMAEYIAGEERLLLMFLPLMEQGRVRSLLLLIWNRWRMERDF